MSHIVVGYDGSACSVEALRWSVDEAMARGWPVPVISVLEPRRVPSMWTASVFAPPPDADLILARERAEDAVSKVVADKGTLQPIDVSARVGHAGPTLVAAASDAGLLVVGHTGTARSHVSCSEA